MKIIISVLLLFVATLYRVGGGRGGANAQAKHGYSSFPIARQRFCNIQNHFDYPPNGDGIPDQMCREAFKYALARHNNPQSQFIQDMEYSRNAGVLYNNLTAIQTKILPTLLCSAGTDKKGGMSLPGNWQTNKIAYTLRGSKFVIDFCATAAHDPSFWQVFVTKPGFDVKTQYLEWTDLEMVWENYNVSLVSQPSTTSCGAGRVYKLDGVPLPKLIPVHTPFIYYIRWQRQDPAGEGFYNCVDMEYI